MRPGRIVVLVVCSLLMLPTIGRLVGGGAGIAYLAALMTDRYPRFRLDQGGPEPAQPPKPPPGAAPTGTIQQRP